MREEGLARISEIGIILVVIGSEGYEFLLDLAIEGIVTRKLVGEARNYLEEGDSLARLGSDDEVADILPFGWASAIWVGVIVLG